MLIKLSVDRFANFLLNLSLWTFCPIFLFKLFVQTFCSNFLLCVCVCVISQDDFKLDFNGAYTWGVHDFLFNYNPGCFGHIRPSSVESVSRKKELWKLRTSKMPVIDHEHLLPSSVLHFFLSLFSLRTSQHFGIFLVTVVLWQKKERKNDLWQNSRLSHLAPIVPSHFSISLVSFSSFSSIRSWRFLWIIVIN